MKTSIYEVGIENLTEAESREYKWLEKETDRIWRNFWVRILNRRGYTIVAIAEAVKISESTVRRIVKEV